MGDLTKGEVTSRYLDFTSQRSTQIQEFIDYLEEKLKVLDPETSEISRNNRGIEEIYEDMESLLKTAKEMKEEVDNTALIIGGR